MMHQNLRVWIPCPNELQDDITTKNEITCRVLAIQESGINPTNLPPNMKVTEPKMMKIKLVKCAPKNQGPLGKITRNQDVDLIGSKFIHRCLCGMRNGLTTECRRISCRSNPACHIKPFPRCWPQYEPIKTSTRELEVPVQLCYLVEN